MSEIQSLVERARKYLRSAEILLNEGDYESCVSRAYYTMFYVAEAALLTKGITSSSHKGVNSAFSRHFIKTGEMSKEMGKALKRAFEKRQLGDYEFTFVIERKEAEEILEDARDFIARIMDYLNL
jgi:uncharacterized protein (UPF0332 family)